MPFWDRFVLALYFGLAQHLPAGRDAALRILDRAIERERLSLFCLNDTSLLLLLALLPETSPHRATAAGLVVAHQPHLGPVQVLQRLRAARPARVVDLVEMSRSPGWQLRQLVLDALCAPDQLGLIENLCLYLGRYYLLDPARLELRGLASGLIAEGTRQYYAAPLGAADYEALLYRRVYCQTTSPAQPPPTAIPACPPDWFVALDPEEQQFLRDCLL
jgi:hypothetical protein